MPTSRPPVEVRRSRRRTRTVSAYHRDGKVIVQIPDRFSARQEAEWVEKMLARLQRKRARSDADLEQRAARLARNYLDGRVEPSSVRWVTNQNTRWGSCTPADASIRLSHRMQPMPDWVVDYVLLHELAHLIEAGHGPAFHRLVVGYPYAERARGYLEGWEAARASPSDGQQGASDEATAGSGGEALRPD